MRGGYRAVAIILIAVSLMWVVTLRASAAGAIELASVINALSGLSASVSGNTVTVTSDGPVSLGNSTLSLAIDAGVTVEWEAEVSGSLNAYLLDISGGGEFRLKNTILSNGSKTAGAIRVSGATTLTVADGGSILAERIGNPVLITAGGATVNITRGGNIRSLTSNSNAAIQINNGLQNVTINVEGGSVISDTSGYGINDGSGTEPTSNNTIVNVTGGVVTASSNSSVHMTGMQSRVIISGGVVSNAAGNNFNPVIDMVGDMGGVENSSVTAPNITVTGVGVVESTSQNGYTIQTRGNVLIDGNANVTAISGRAINLVGYNSTATIRGNARVQGSGVNVISSATTDNLIPSVTNTKVIVEGGMVTSTGSGASNAINVTGINSSVVVSGGIVTASGTGNTINAASTATSATIKVSGDASTQVMATGSGDAIYIAGSGAREAVTITGGQVTARDGLAVNIRSSNATLGLTGGFVFAYGSEMKNVINSSNITNPTHLSGVGRVVCAWAGTPGESHLQGTFSNIHLWTGNAGHAAYWYNHPSLGGGISYNYGATGFFPLPVTIANDHGLIFNSVTGDMYRDVNGNGVIDSPEDSLFLTGRDMFGGKGAWEGYPGKLVLNNFSWVTNAPTALTIIGGYPTTIVTESNSIFESKASNTSAIAVGIRILDSTSVTLDGKGTLRAVGDKANGIGLDLGSGTLTISGGAFIAQGRARAITWDNYTVSETADTDGPDGVLYHWKWSQNFDGTGTNKNDSSLGGDWNEGINVDAPFEFFESDKFVEFRALRHVSFTAEQIGGISHIADSVAIVLTFSSSVEQGSLSTEHIEITDGTGKVVSGALTGSGTTWVLSLHQVDAEGIINLSVSDFGTYFVTERDSVEVNVYMAMSYNLAVLPEVGDTAAGGSTSGDISGKYFKGAPISVSAVPNSGFHFTGWVVEGAVLKGEAAESDAEFDMPDNDVTIRATFAPNLLYNTLNLYTGMGGRVSGTTSGAYPTNHVVSVTAIPDDGYYFTGWSVEGTAATSNSETLTFQMPQNTVSLWANFAPIHTFTLAVNAIGGGTTEGSFSGQYLAGAQINVLPIPNEGFHFVSWTVDGIAMQRGNLAQPAIFKMPAGDVTLNAYFEENPENTNTLNVIAGENGAISGTQSGAFSEDEEIGVTAIPDYGFHFTEWTIVGVDGLNISDGGLIFPMPNNSVRLIANFAPSVSYTLTVTSTEGGTTSGSNTRAYYPGESINVTATPNEGYHFTKWEVSGAAIIGGETANPAMFYMPSDNVVLTAIFAPNPLTYTLNVYSGIGGSTVGTISGAYPEHYPVSVTAVPRSGYYFTGWTVSIGETITELSADSGLFEILMSAEKVSLTANFAPHYYSLVVSAGAGGSLSGTQSGQSYTGELIELTAKANVGYRFTGWTVSGAVITGGSTANPARFYMPPNDVTLTANFEFVFSEADETDSQKNNGASNNSGSSGNQYEQDNFYGFSGPSNPNEVYGTAHRFDAGVPQTGVSYNILLPIVSILAGISIVFITALLRFNHFQWGTFLRQRNDSAMLRKFAKQSKR